MTADASWQGSMPEVYDRCLGPALFAPFAVRTAEVAARRAPASVLELAAGTGILTVELVRALPAAQITATDLNPAMVSWAAGHRPEATWQVSDAQHLEFPDSTFDLVVCQFGVMFFPDRPAALAEASRVLRPDGELVFTVWDSVDTSTFPAALVASLVDVFPDDPPDFVARIPHGYHDLDRVRRDVDAGGLETTGIDRVVLRGAASSARVLAEGFCRGTPLRFALEQRGDLAELTELVAAQLAWRLGPGPVEGELCAHLVSARPRQPNRRATNAAGAAADG